MLILACWISKSTFAQKAMRDSLQLKISKMASDTAKVKLLIDFNYFFDDAERDSCLKVAYELSKKIGFRYGLIWGRFYEGRLLLHAGRYDEAIEKYKSCIDGLDSLGYIQNLTYRPLSEIRWLFNLAGKQEQKFQYYNEKLAFYKKHGPIENTANCYHGIAGYYAYLGDHDKSIGYYFRARDVYKSFSPEAYANETQVIGSEYLLWGNLNKAEVYLRSALKELKQLKLNLFFCYHQLGDLCFQRKDYKRALQYYFEGKRHIAIPELQLINLVNCAAVHLRMNSLDSAWLYLDSAEKLRQRDRLGLVFSNGNAEIDYNLYLYYAATRNKSMALQHLEAALKLAKSSRSMPLVLKYTNELHTCMLKTGDSLQALRYLVQYKNLQDSLNAKSTYARIATFEIEQLQQQKENEIQQLLTQEATQRNYYLVGGVFLFLAVMALLSRLRYKRKRDKEQLTTDFKRQLAQAETKALRAQMNPHFIFNSLSSINSFVMDQKHEIASEYLIKFSKLIRLILDNSRSETISIEKELETLKLYVLLESARFENRFKCIYQIADDVNSSTIMIPPMLLQPFVENAIWHGLMQKETEGTITVEIKKENEEFLNISVTDDGIGREKAASLKSKSATHKSHGLKVTSQRIDMMNKLNSTGAQVDVLDLKDESGHPTGTRVVLIIPI